MIEIEVKARVDDPKRMERAIIALGATPTGVEDQADTYYNPPFRNFEKTDEALRIRVLEGKSFLTYKGPKMDSVSKTRKEFEVEINDAENMGKILSYLGFSPVATVTKRRKIYRLGDFFISLDEVRNLGDFLEVELSAKDPRNYEEKVESLFKLIEKLGISRQNTIRESYLEMMLGKR